MELTQLQKIKSLLPIEVTAAFVAFQTILNGEALPQHVGGFVGQNDHLGIMLVLIIFLSLANAALLWGSGQKGRFQIGFSTLGFVIWATNLDKIRWQDKISELGVSVEFSIIILPILAVVYSVLAAVFATNSALEQRISEKFEGKKNA